MSADTARQTNRPHQTQRCCLMGQFSWVTLGQAESVGLHLTHICLLWSAYCEIASSLISCLAPNFVFDGLKPSSIPHDRTFVDVSHQALRTVVLSGSLLLIYLYSDARLLVSIEYCMALYGYGDKPSSSTLSGRYMDTRLQRSDRCCRLTIMKYRV